MEPRVADTGVITTVHLAILAVVALIVIAGIVWGIRLQRQRRAARRVETERIETSGGAVPNTVAPVSNAEAAPANMPPTPAPVAHPATRVAPTSAPPATPPIAPPPPPLVEERGESAPLADEPIAAAAPLDASPATVADPTPMPELPPAPAENTPAPPPGSPPGDRPVTSLKGLGPKVAARLAELGVATVGDMAALDAVQAETIDARLGPFTGRMTRDRWIEQARFLAAGDVKGFEAVFGKL